MAVKIAYLARGSSPAALQAPPHTAQASASAHELDRGYRPGRHQRWTRARVISPVAGSRRTTTVMLPPCSRSGSKTVLQGRGTGPAGIPWRISYSPLIQQMRCYTKSLKSHTERVRPQLLSLRQFHQLGYSFRCARRRPEPRRMSAFRLIYPNHGDGLRSPFWAISCLSSAPFSDTTEPRPFWYGCEKPPNSRGYRDARRAGV